MTGSEAIIIINVILLIVLASIKTVYFYRATRRRSFKKWLHFNQFQIMDASSDDIKRLRQGQNTLTAIVFVLGAILFAVVVLAAKGML